MAEAARLAGPCAELDEGALRAAADPFDAWVEFLFGALNLGALSVIPVYADYFDRTAAYSRQDCSHSSGTHNNGSLACCT